MNKVLLTFDVEEFDVPLEFKGHIPFDQQIEESTKGLNKVMDLIGQYDVRCTFFTTAQYAISKTALMKEVAKRHEIASHGYYHSSFENADLKKSKDKLESLLDVNITGYRMARLAPVDDAEIAKAGYTYNSSMNPTWIPGRYNHLDKPRTPYFSGDVLTIPTSVTPTLRIPLFWLSFKNFPMPLLKYWMKRTLRHDGFLSLYFHPWEFTDITGYGLPGYISKRSGEQMLQRLEDTIKMLKAEAEFVTMEEFAKGYKR